MPRLLPSVLLALVLGACTAPVPEDDGAPAQARSPASADGAAAPAPAPAQLADAGDATPAPPAPGRRAPPTGGPLPADVVPDKEVALDRSCRSDADCEVKNVGNCCGYYPACLNKDSPTDPAGVQARCARDGVMSTCGFPTIESCRCDAGKCTEQLQMVDGQVPPAPEPVDR